MTVQNWLSKSIKLLILFCIIILFCITIVFAVQIPTLEYVNINYSEGEGSSSPSGFEWNGSQFTVKNVLIYEYFSNWTYTTISHNVATEDTTMRDIAWNGSHYIGTGDSNNDLFIYFSNWTYTGTSISLSFGPWGITYVEPYYWIVDRSNDIVRKYYSNFTYTGTNFDTSSEDISMTGIFWDGNLFWVTGGYQHVGLTSKVFYYTPDGTYTGSFHDFSSQDTLPRDIETNNDENYLWMLGGDTDRVYKYSINYCIPPVSGNWNITSGKTCSLNSSISVANNLNILDGSIIILNSGELNISGDYIYIYPGSNLTILPGGQING